VSHSAIDTPQGFLYLILAPVHVPPFISVLLQCVSLSLTGIPGILAFHRCT
jgi:hypothetical protein